MKRRSKLSSEHATALENAGFVKAGYDPARDKEIFYRALKENSTIDPNMLPREYYNNSGHDLVFKLWEGKFRYPEKSPARKFEFVQKSFPKESFIFCPHGYYMPYTLDGSKFLGSLHTNLGDEMGKGQTKLSRPEAPITRVFQRR